MTLRRLEVGLDDAQNDRETVVEWEKWLQVEVRAEGLEAGISLGLS
jgi:hypothetical protein